jgi:apolipoprotein N-acyltransferase
MAFAPRLRRLIEAAAAITATAVLAWFGTGLNPVWPLLWFAPLPVLLFAGRARWWSTAGVAFVGWLIGNLSFWTYMRHAIEVPFGIAIGMVGGFALVFTLAVLLYRTLLRRGAAWYALFAFPAAWVAFEYLLNVAWVNGTAFNLAYTQLAFLPFLQLASITGPWGMSFLLLLFPTAIAISRQLWRRRRGTALAIVGASFATIAAVLIFGTVRLAMSQPSQTLRVGLIASDTHDMAGAGAPAMQVFRAYATRIAALAARGAQVVVLPEKSAVVNQATQPAVDAFFGALSDRTAAAIAVGVTYEAAGKTLYNQARLYRPFKPVSTYAKHHLLPPFESEFTPGEKLTTFAFANSRLGIEICKDMDFTPLSRKYGRDAVGLMLVPAIDFDVDRTFHGHMAIMRGVESGFTVARSARLGYLTVSDERGRILGQARSDSASFATVLVDAPVAHDRTLFLAWGDWFAWLAAAVLVFALLELTRPSVPVMRRGEHAGAP